MTRSTAADDWRTAHTADGECPIAHTLRVLGASKWTGPVLRELLDGPRRFSELRGGLDGVHAKPLTETLRIMEGAGLVTRSAQATVPPRVDYALTERARSLAPVLAEMSGWGLRDLGR